MVKEQRFELTRVGNKVLLWLEDVNFFKENLNVLGFVKRVRGRWSLENHLLDYEMNTILLKKFITAKLNFQASEPPS